MWNLGMTWEFAFKHLVTQITEVFPLNREFIHSVMVS